MFINKYTLFPSNLYQLTLIVSLVSLLRGEVTINPNNFIFLCSQYLSLVLMTILLGSVLHKYSFRWQLIIVFFVLLSLYVGFINQRGIEMYATCAFIFGAKGEKYEDVLRYYFSVSLFFCVSIIILNRMGLVRESLTAPMGREGIFTDESVVRHSFGYVWSTDFATHVFFILLTYWILRKGKIGKLFSLIYLIIVFLIIKYSDARLGAGSILLLVVASFYLYLRKRFMAKKTFPKSYKLVVIWIPFLFLLIYYLTIWYDDANTNAVILNLLLSGRLSISQDVIREYGIKMFGQYYIQYGGTSSKIYYNFIDSSYLQLLVIYGIIYTICYVGAYVYLTYKAYKRKDEVLLIAILIAGFTGAISQHFIQIYMNPILIALFTNHIYRLNVPSQKDITLPAGGTK